MTQPAPPPNYSPEVIRDVYECLGEGLLRLAVCRSRGIPYSPFDLEVSALFASQNVVDVVDAATKQKIQQDTLVRQIGYSVTNQNSASDPLTIIGNFFFSLQSGIVCRLKVEGPGPGGYNPIVDFEPIEIAVGNGVRGPRVLCRPWGLTYNTGMKMDFHASVPLPFPVQVDVVFHTETCKAPQVWDMAYSDAVMELKAKNFNLNGYVIQ